MLVGWWVDSGSCYLVLLVGWVPKYCKTANWYSPSLAKLGVVFPGYESSLKVKQNWVFINHLKLKRKTAASNEQSSFASGPSLMKLSGSVLCQATWDTYWVLSQQFLFCLTLSNADISMCTYKIYFKVVLAVIIPSKLKCYKIWNVLIPWTEVILLHFLVLFILKCGWEQYFNGKKIKDHVVLDVSDGDIL